MSKNNGVVEIDFLVWRKILEMRDRIGYAKCELHLASRDLRLPDAEKTKRDPASDKYIYT